jgi:mRNA turnover protein 4
LFTNRETAEVAQWFAEYGEADFARSGDIATETVTLPVGPLPQFSHAIEPHLRKLGMPTSLQKGIITMLKPMVVATKGDVLTPERANILKLLGNMQASFHITLTHGYNEEEGVTVLQAE